MTACHLATKASYSQWAIGCERVHVTMLEEALRSQKVDVRHKFVFGHIIYM